MCAVRAAASCILKPLAAALADGDPIRAVILGTGVNSDGRTIGVVDCRTRRRRRRCCARSMRAPRSIPRTRLFRGARHRHACRRSGRMQRRLAGRVGQRRRRAAADRLGQDQYRPSGAGVGHCRADEGGAGARPRDVPPTPALSSPSRKSRSTSSTCRLVRDAEAADRRLLAGPRGGQFVRVWRHQRACRPRSAAAPEPRRRSSSGRPAAVDLGGQRSFVARTRAWLARRPRSRSPAGAAPRPHALPPGGGSPSPPAGSARRRPAPPTPACWRAFSTIGDAPGRISGTAVSGGEARLRVLREWCAIPGNGARRTARQPLPSGPRSRTWTAYCAAAARLVDCRADRPRRRHRAGGPHRYSPAAVVRDPDRHRGRITRRWRRRFRVSRA